MALFSPAPTGYRTSMQGEHESPAAATSADPATEGVDPRYRGLDAWPVSAALDAIWEAQLAAVAAVRPALPALAEAAEAAADALRGGGRLIYVGAGASGRLAAQDAAELAPTFGWPSERALILLAGGEGALMRSVEGAEDDVEDGRRRAGCAVRGDVAIGLAASGRTPFTVAALEEARRRGALTIAVACAPATPLAAAAHHAVVALTGPEVLAGSTRMKAGTAQKVILNALSTAVMTRLGRVHDGRMVEMQAGNAKLRRRAATMVTDIAGCDAAAAERALHAAGWDVKAAALVAMGDAPERACERLRAAGGRLRDAIAARGAG